MQSLTLLTLLFYCVIHVILSSLPGITFIELYVAAGFEGQFPVYLQVQF